VRNCIELVRTDGEEEATISREQAHGPYSTSSVFAFPGQHHSETRTDGDSRMRLRYNVGDVALGSWLLMAGMIPKFELRSVALP
jgi:hypothetical protein